MVLQLLGVHRALWYLMKVMDLSLKQHNPALIRQQIGVDFKKVQGPHVQVLLSILALFPRILGGKLRLLGDDVRRDGNGRRPPRVGGPWKYWIGGSGLMAKRKFCTRNYSVSVYELQRAR